MPVINELLSTAVQLRKKQAGSIHRHSTNDGLLLTSVDKTTPRTRTRALSTISVDHYDLIVGELRCAGCSEPLSAEIRLCAGGHSLCAACVAAAAAVGSPVAGAKCPLCAQPLTAVRSLALEQLAARAVFGCANAAHGCPVRLTSEALRDHRRKCPFQLGDCFMGRVWGGCEWRGRELDWLRHCQSAHADRIFEGVDERLLRWPADTSIWGVVSPTGGRRAATQTKLTAYYVFRVFGETFNLYQVCNPKQRRVSWTVICASTDPQIEHRFAFEVELTLPGDVRLGSTQRHACHGERDEDVLHEEKCATFRQEDILRFVDSSKVLHYYVRIIAIPPKPVPDLSPSSRRAAEIATAVQADRNTTKKTADEQLVGNDIPPALTNHMDGGSSSTASSIVIVCDAGSSTTTSDHDSLAGTLHQKQSLVARKELQCDSYSALQSVQSTAFHSPQLVFAQMTANLVPKPPRSSLDRAFCNGSTTASNTIGINDNDDETEIPLPPSTPAPRDDKCILFAKTNVTE